MGHLHRRRRGRLELRIAFRPVQRWQEAGALLALVVGGVAFGWIGAVVALGVVVMAVALFGWLRRRRMTPPVAPAGERPPQRPQRFDDVAIHLLWAGAVLAVVGGVLFVDNSDEHHRCQGFAGALAADACRAVAWRYYLGLAGLIVGVVLIVLGVRRRR